MSQLKIGITGAHRTGKTTTMYALIERYPFKCRPLSFSASEVQKDMGYDSSIQSYDWETRKNIQTELLDAFIDEISSKRLSPFTLMDRTPLDFIAYTLLNAPDVLTEKDRMWVDSYINVAIKAINLYITDLVLIQPGIKLVEDAKSAPLDSVDAVAAIIYKFLLDPRITVRKHIIPSEMTNLDDRIKFIEGIFNDRSTL